MTAHAMLARMGHLMAGLGAVHALLIVCVFMQPSQSAEYVMTMILVGNAAGAVSPSAGYLRGYLEWAAVYGGTLVAVWLLKGFIDEIPREYEEAALIDGYTRFQAFRKVVLPQAATGIASTAIFVCQ